MIEKIPAISVIAPMYNVEKYISECLDSLLNQTFKDFEFIIVDDRSTDRSAEIVESYISKFDGRLRLVKLQKNSGGAGTPRNIAIQLSRGEYIANIDSDDLFTKTALEEFYTVAKKMNADVVHCEKNFVMTDDHFNGDLSKLKITSSEQVKFVTVPTYETTKLNERIVKYSKSAYWGYPWTKFCRRDFLMENDIKFPTIMTRDDIMFCFQCICLAKNYVRVPNVVNIYRIRDDSHSHVSESNTDFEKYLNKWMTDLIEGVKFMDNFMNGIKFFVDNPQFKYMAFDRFMQEELNWYMKSLYKKYPIHKFDKILREIFSKFSKDDTALITFMFSMINIYRIKLQEDKETIKLLNKQVETLKEKLNEQVKL